MLLNNKEKLLTCWNGYERSSKALSTSCMGLHYLSLVKTRTVQCKDGSEKRVYEDVNDPFPLFNETTDYAVTVDQTNTLIQQLIPHVSLEVRNKLTTLFSQLSSIHASMQLKFRAAYAVYQIDPCAEGADEHLRKTFERIQDPESHLLEIQKQIINQLSPGVKNTLTTGGESPAPKPDEIEVGIPSGAPNVYYIDRQFLKSMQWRDSNIDQHIRTLENVSLS